MNEAEKLKQQIAYNTAIALGLCNVLTTLFVAHVRTIGGDVEIAVSEVRTLLNESVNSLKLTGTTRAGQETDFSENIHKSVTGLMDQVEVNARRILGQMSETSNNQ